MKRQSLKVLSSVLIIGSVVAWFQEPSRKIDWIPLFVVGVVVSIVEARISDLEKRLAKVEVPSP